MTIGYIYDAISQVVDDVVANKYGMVSPIPLIIIILVYLLIIHKIAPSFMKSRPAFQLKTYMVVYNVFQVTCCIYLVYKICVVNAPTLQFWECGAFERGSPVEKDYNHICVLSFWLKVTELSETVVFVLRKKERQISFLHVFHHCATLLLVYLLYTKYTGSSGLYPLFLNCNVHIVMYMYYLMSAALPANVVAQLTPLKKAITTVQMVQFALILLQVALGLIRGCEINGIVIAVYVLIITIFFYMFYDFYKKNYNARRQPAGGESKKNLTNN